MMYIGDKGREVYTTFEWALATGSGDTRVPAENETLNGMLAKFEAYVAPQCNQIRATVNFQQEEAGIE